MIQGFAPNFYFDSHGAGLQIYVSPGTINGTSYNGQVITVAANNTNYISVDNSGNITSSTSGYASANQIGIVVTGQIVTSGDTLTNASGALAVEFSNGIVSITDTRTFG